MDLAWISLLALVIVIVVSCTSRINPGVVAVVLAWVIGVYLAPLFGTPIGIRQLMAGFPSDLFLTLTGVTLLFTLAQLNGTLERVAHFAVRCCRGNVGLIPVMYFALTLGLATIGAGNIAGAALMAPLAMATAARARIPAFLMFIMVAHGAIAGALSPFSPTGIIAKQILDKHELGGMEWKLYAHNLLANVAVAAVGYLAFGGWKLFGRTYQETEPPTTTSASAAPEPAPAVRFETRHAVTLAIIVLLILAVVGARVNVGLAAFAGAMVLILLRMGDEEQAIKQMPWGVMLMVCGVTVLTTLLEKTGGTERFEDLVAAVANAQTVTGIIALLTGVISVYSSTSGVVLPAFLPMVARLATKVGGADPQALAYSIIVGGHLVDSSPLSTIGALCIASAPPDEDRGVLFFRVLVWGLSMAVVGAVFCYVVYGLL